MRYFKISELCVKEKDLSVRCLACQRMCVIANGGKGFCKVRVNKDGNLLVPYGYFSSLHIDPIEKKPLYHFLAGSYTLSFGMFGCNLRCLYCQNWEISQIDGFKGLDNISEYIIEANPCDVYNIMKEKDLRIIVSTYNEPTVSIEWAYDIFSYAKRIDKGIKTGFVTNGYLSCEAVDYILPYIDFIRIDIKAFDREKFNRLTSADFNKYISSVKYIASKNLHIEFVNLVVEGFNDGLDEFNDMIDFISSISKDIPLHLTAFHPDYKMTDRKRTQPSTIENLISFAKGKGLRYVYGGNYMSSSTDTICPSCSFVVVKRGYMNTEFKDIRVNNGEGFCPKCGQKIYGFWQ